MLEDSIHDVSECNYGSIRTCDGNDSDTDVDTDDEYDVDLFVGLLEQNLDARGYTETERQRGTYGIINVKPGTPEQRFAEKVNDSYAPHMSILDSIRRGSAFVMAFERGDGMEYQGVVTKDDANLSWCATSMAKSFLKLCGDDSGRWRLFEPNPSPTMSGTIGHFVIGDLESSQLYKVSFRCLRHYFPEMEAAQFRALFATRKVCALMYNNRTVAISIGREAITHLMIDDERDIHCLRREISQWMSWTGAKKICAFNIRINSVGSRCIGERLRGLVEAIFGESLIIGAKGC